MDGTKIRKFLNLKKDQLSSYLRARGVVVTNEKHRELAERAYWAEKLGLVAKPTDREAQVAIENSKERKLNLDGGMIRLPRPESLSKGWEASPASLPDTTRAHIDSYIKTAGRKVGLENTEGVKTLGLGKGLYMSNHVRGLAYHGINPNINYCFVRGKVIPQTNINDDPYFSWVVLNKDSGHITTAECSCIVGIQAGCKHVTALLFAVAEAVEQGRNNSSTSQKMVWNAPPKKGDKVHTAKFAEDIKIVQVKQDVSSQNTEASKGYRSRYDPRVVKDRVHRPISEFELDRLAQITNGKTGLLMYSKMKPDPSREQPNISEVEQHVEINTTVEAPTVSEAFSKLKPGCRLVNKEVTDNLSINQHQQKLLALSTSKQASSHKWLEHRKGRITSSVAGDCAAAVSGTPPKLKSSHSCVARIMGYYGNPTSPALQWGKNREGMARKHYVAHHRLHKKHSGVSCTDTGLWVSLKFPYVAGSPDGIVNCKECGHGLVEIKNPYTHRHMTISELVKQKESSGLICENDVVHLDRLHKYYAQVQTQLHTTGYEWCDFVVHTSSPNDNIHVERVLLDNQYLSILMPKLTFFFSNAIIPELRTGHVKEQVIKNAVHKTMENILNKLDKSCSTTLSLGGCLYPCGICGDDCESNPIDDSHQSIGCDKCHLWYHYSCVGLTGQELFISRRKSKWNCDKCKKVSRKRKMCMLSEP